MTERIAIISDIHGNSPALREVLENIHQHGCDKLVVLGDIINGIDPQGCVDLLLKWDDKVCIRGNAEAYTLTPDLESLPDAETFSNDELIQLIEWFRGQLNMESLQWLADLPNFYIEHGNCYAHDSPIDRLEPQRWYRPGLELKYQEWFYHAEGIRLDMPERQWDELIHLLQRYSISHVFCGHTHIPFQRKIGDRLIVNAGSVGLPLDGDTRACWVLVEGYSDEMYKISFQRVKYELSEIVELVDRTPDYPRFNKPGAKEAYKNMLLTGVFSSV